MEHLSDARIKELELKAKLIAFFKKPHVSLSALVLGGTLFAFSGGVHQPLLPTTDPFVLFATESLTLEQDTQVSSGDLGSNGSLAIDKNVLVTGDLFAKIITIDKNTVVNGNASFNNIKLHKESQILGAQTKPTPLPIANIPAFSDSTIGTESRTVSGATTALAPGNYRDITIEQASTIVLSSGTYNLSALELKDHATLIFTGTTTINIARTLKGGSHVSILPGLHTIPDQLIINYNGTPSVNEHAQKTDAAAIPVIFGNRAFLNGRLFAPNANVIIGKESTLRGQVVARGIMVKKEGVVSRTESFAMESDPGKVVENQGIRFMVNEIVILLTPDATISDAQAIASLVGGTLTGFVPNPPTYKVEVFASMPAELFAFITQMKSSGNPKLIEAVPNLLSEQ